SRAGDLGGMVARADIERAALEGRGQATAGAICTRDPLICHPDESLGEALRQWGARDVGRLPVVERANPRRLLGMLRRADVVSAYSHLAQGQQERPAADALFPHPHGALGGLRFFEFRLEPGSAAV